MIVTFCEGWGSTVTAAVPRGPGVPGERTSLAGTGEDRLVDLLTSRLARRAGGTRGRLLEVGPGDDAAVLAGPAAGGKVVLSTDTLVEGHDFRRDWSAPEEIGVKVVAQGLADVASMGARPVAFLLSLAAPGELDVSWALLLADGVADECDRAGAVVAGGDVSAASSIVLTGTAVGLLEGPAVLRSGARTGDVVALAGRTGPSAAGLALLAGGVVVGRSGHPELLEAHRAPRPDYAAGTVAAGAGAHALIDVSDGLLRDASRIAVASGVRIDLDSRALSPDGDLVRAARAVGHSDRDASATARGWVLTGGEDHAFLGCFDPGKALPAGFRPVGRVLGPPPGTGRPGDHSTGPRGGTGPDGGTWPVATVDGVHWDGPTGWTHFTRRVP